MPAETITSEVLKNCVTPISEDHDEKFGVPSLEELGKFLCLCVFYHPSVSELGANCSF